MLKIKLICIFILCIIITTSCTLLGETTMTSNDTIIATETFEKIRIAIDTKNAVALKELFSVNVCNSVENIGEDIEYLFEMIQGKIILYPEKILAVTRNEYNHGDVQIISKSWDYFETDQKEKFYFCFIECTKDTENPDNEGLSMLQILRADSTLTEHDPRFTAECIGIYRDNQ